MSRRRLRRGMPPSVGSSAESATARSEKRAARLSTMAAEMSLRREISHARGHKRKMKAEEEDTPEGLRHLKKPEPQFKWKKERKR